MTSARHGIRNNGTQMSIALHCHQYPQQKDDVSVVVSSDAWALVMLHFSRGGKDGDEN